MPETVKNRFELLDRLGLGGKSCAEIGVSWGGYSVEILRRRPSKLLLVDHWNVKDSGHVHCQPAGEKGFLRVSLLFKNDPTVRIVRKYSFDAALDLPDGELDFAYIDANHNTPYLYADLILWYLKLKKGGWLAGHDLDNPDFEVKKVLDMFTLITGEQLVYVTAEPTCKSFVFRKSR